MGNRFPLPPTRYPLSPNPYLLLFFSSLRLCVFAFFSSPRFFLPSQARQEQKRGLELLV